MPNQPNKEMENARFTMRAPASPNARRTSKYELKPVLAPIDPINQPMRKITRAPPKIAAKVRSEPTPLDTSMPAMNVGSEKDTIDATAATRNDATRASVGTA